MAWEKAPRALVELFAESLPDDPRIERRKMFGYPAIRAALPHWEADARFALAVFRMDIARAGGSPEAIALAAELQATSADFRRLWAENEMRSHWIGLKHLHRPSVGSFTLETLAFAVDGAEGLSMVVFTPVSPADVRAVETLIAKKSTQASDK